MKKIKDENTKQKILDCATKLFAMKGFNGTSIRDICKEANVNLCLISYYWGGKRELYLGIIDNVIKRQTEYVKTFCDLKKMPSEMTQKERINLIYLWIDKFIDFFYSDKISPELITLILKEQQQKDFVKKSPAFLYFRALVASLLNKDENDREVIFKTLFILSQVNSPRILTGLSLNLLNRDVFEDEDIKIIRDNVKSYIGELIKKDSAYD